MTTVMKAIVTCGVCGNQQQLHVLGSTSSFGAPDLDLRPAEVARSTLGYWITACPECGYAAAELGEADEATQALVRSPAFAEVLAAAAALVERMRPFAVAAALAEASGDLARAAELHLWTAWAGDDLGEPAAAVAARRRAVAAMQRAHESGALVYGDAERDGLVLVDMLRRADRMPEARAVCTELLARTEDDAHRAVARLQLVLCADGDRGCHRLRDAGGG